MSPLVVGLALFAAVLHAAWNAFLRSGADRLWTVTVMSFASTLVALPCLFLQPLPAPGAWLYIALSALLQVGYSLFLVAAYRHGELGQVYPVVRGSVPLLVTLGGFLLLGERLGLGEVAGVALVAAGIMSLALGKGKASTRSLLLRGRLSLDLRARETWKALGGGLVAMLAYGAVVAAFALGPAGPITALRETSVIFAALLGRLFLGETLTLRRIAACSLVVMGTVWLGDGV